MQAIEYYAEVLEDGHLSLPKEVRESLKLKHNSKVRVLLLSSEKSEEFLESIDEESLIESYKVMAEEQSKRVEESILAQALALGDK